MFETIVISCEVKLKVRVYPSAHLAKPARALPSAMLSYNRTSAVATVCNAFQTFSNPASLITKQPAYMIFSPAACLS